jgi:hypothetical protein
VLKRHGIDPSQPPDKTECKVPHVIALAVKDPLLAPMPILPRRTQRHLARINGNLDAVVVNPPNSHDDREFHYLVKVSGSALTFHFRTNARNAATAERTVLDIPNLIRWSALIGAALVNVLADEKTRDSE